MSGIVEKIKISVKENTRLSDIPPSYFQHISTKSSLKKYIKRGLIKLNDKVAGTGDFVNNGDVIEILSYDLNENAPTITLPLEILYEDDFLAIINKPAGIIVSGNKKLTIENALPRLLQCSNEKDALKRPHPVHRLDYPTSGALLIGKTKNAVRILNSYFENREIKKTYLAVTIGEMTNEGYVKKDIDDKFAETEYLTLKSVISQKYGFLNLVKLWPLTGRRHQLRIHMASIGSPIFGDKNYGIEGKISKGNGLYLHAYQIEFIHPFTHEKINVKIDPGKKFLRLFSLE